MEPLLKSYIRYAMGFVPKERMTMLLIMGNMTVLK